MFLQNWNHFFCKIGIIFAKMESFCEIGIKKWFQFCNDYNFDSIFAKLIPILQKLWFQFCKLIPILQKWFQFCKSDLEIWFQFCKTLIFHQYLVLGPQFAPSCKIRSNFLQIKSFITNPHALLLIDAAQLQQWLGISHPLERHPFSGLVHSAGELLHTP